MQKESVVRDPGLAPEGHKKIDWAAGHSPVLNIVRDKYLKDGTFDGLGVGVALPVEAKTAYLTLTLAEAGADVAVASPGPFFVQDDVAAALAERGVTVYASSENDPEDADRELERVLDRAVGDREAVFIDDRAGLVRLAHTTRRNLLGYGWCGKGIARYAAGLGARISVCEVDPVRGLEAYADGFDVLPALDAAEIGEIFITATGSRDVLTAAHFERMRDGAVLANAGGVDVEIDVDGLAATATGAREVRRNVEEFTTSGGRRLHLVGRGMVVNLTASDGHPIEIMDLTFAIQALCAYHLANEHASMDNIVHLLPREIDDEVAAMKLDAVGMGVDALTTEQEEFLAGWRE